MTSLGMNWILCSFKSEEAMEEVFNGGPWFVGGYIVGMDKWTASFNPNSFKEITAPVWICFPSLPLYCWDEENISRIVSRIGVPMYVDGNSFRWSKHEFARVCVRLNLKTAFLKVFGLTALLEGFFSKLNMRRLIGYASTAERWDTRRWYVLR
ncbi:hypothetical protein MA16_Dca016916 [Dendrobium catenatum]|uniref:DUF4283 domain-containing protein n=1 Tax=Dendrobium catenatum TaxID=906689 RepID=A0A2I0XI52_9ASPA|nr:hypothetical protein MA16_Dca016916 [Dendrobium catenatum]